MALQVLNDITCTESDPCVDCRNFVFEMNAQTHGLGLAATLKPMTLPCTKRDCELPAINGFYCDHHDRIVVPAPRQVLETYKADLEPGDPDGNDPLVMAAWAALDFDPISLSTVNTFWEQDAVAALGSSYDDFSNVPL